jgi:hypothetical protein
MLELPFFRRRYAVTRWQTQIFPLGLCPTVLIYKHHSVFILSEVRFFYVEQNLMHSDLQTGRVSEGNRNMKLYAYCNKGPGWDFRIFIKVKNSVSSWLAVDFLQALRVLQNWPQRELLRQCEYENAESQNCVGQKHSSTSRNFKLILLQRPEIHFKLRIFFIVMKMLSQYLLLAYYVLSNALKFL